MRSGFSLLELLVVLGILAVVGLLGYSNFSPAYRLQAAATELQKALQTARTEAIRRGDAVTVEMANGELLVKVGSQTLARFRPQNYGATLQAPVPGSFTLNALGRPGDETKKEFTLAMGNRTRSLTLEASGRIH